MVPEQLLNGAWVAIFSRMRVAFKEWAVVVDALERGDQIIILRKGGISEGKGGFKVDHPELLLFPTLFHQQREAVVESAQRRYDEIAPHFPGADRVRISSWAKVIEWKQLIDWQSADSLTGLHIWRREVISERFEWGKVKNIFALALRVYRLTKEIQLPMSPSYAGCKSWIELETEIPTADARPVLSEAAFALKLAQFREALANSPTVAESQTNR